MECLLPYLCMMTVPYIMVGLERMLDYRGVGLVRFHCISYTVLHYPWRFGWSRLHCNTTLLGHTPLT